MIISSKASTKTGRVGASVFALVFTLLISTPVFPGQAASLQQAQEEQATAQREYEKAQGDVDAAEKWLERTKQAESRAGKSLDARNEAEQQLGEAKRNLDKAKENLDKQNAALQRAREEAAAGESRRQAWLDEVDKIAQQQFGSGQLWDVTLRREERVTLFSLYQMKLTDLDGQVVGWGRLQNPNDADSVEGRGKLEENLAVQTGALVFLDAEYQAATEEAMTYTAPVNQSWDDAYQEAQQTLRALSSIGGSGSGFEKRKESARAVIEQYEKRQAALTRADNASKAKDQILASNPLLGRNVTLESGAARPLWQVFADPNTSAAAETDATNQAIGQQVGEIQKVRGEISSYNSWNQMGSLVLDQTHTPLQGLTVGVLSQRHGYQRAGIWMNILSRIYASHQEDIRLDRQGTNLLYMAVGTGVLVFTGLGAIALVGIGAGGGTIATFLVLTGAADATFATAEVIEMSRIAAEAQAEYDRLEAAVKASKGVDSGTGGSVDAKALDLARERNEKAQNDLWLAKFGRGASYLGFAADALDAGVLVLRNLDILKSGRGAGSIVRSSEGNVIIDLRKSGITTRPISGSGDAMDTLGAVTRSGEIVGARRAVNPGTPAQRMDEWIDYAFENPPDVTKVAPEFANKSWFNLNNPVHSAKNAATQIYAPYRAVTEVGGGVVEPNAFIRRVEDSVKQAVDASGSNADFTFKAIPQTANNNPGSGWIFVVKTDSKTGRTVDRVGDLVRVYVNVDPTHAPEFINWATRTILDDPDRLGGVYRMKVAAAEQASKNSDVVLIWAENNETADAMVDAIRRYSDEHPGRLRGETPWATQQRSPGVGVADDPSPAANEAVRRAMASATDTEPNSKDIIDAFGKNSFGSLRGNALYRAWVDIAQEMGVSLDLIPNVLKSMPEETKHFWRNRFSERAQHWLGEFGVDLADPSRNKLDGVASVVGPSTGAGQSARVTGADAQTLDTAGPSVRAADEGAQGADLKAGKDAMESVTGSSPRRGGGRVIAGAGRAPEQVGEAFLGGSGSAGAGSNSSGEAGGLSTSGGGSGTMVSAGAAESGGDAGEVLREAVLFVFGKSDKTVIVNREILDEDGVPLGIVVGPPVPIPGAGVAFPIRITRQNATAVESSVSNRTGAETSVDFEKTSDMQDGREEIGVHRAVTAWGIRYPYIRGELE